MAEGDATIPIKVSIELLAELEEWSDPVQIRIVRFDNGEYTMEARKVDAI